MAIKELLIRGFYLLSGSGIIFLIIRNILKKDGVPYWKVVVVCFLISVVLEVLLSFVQFEDPAIKAVANQLQSKPDIENRIRKYVGYGYNKNHINLDKMPSNFNFRIIGADSTIHLKVHADSVDNEIRVIEYNIQKVTAN